MSNLYLIAIPTLIWGSTWLAITYQLGYVDPLVSVVYRFAAASVILLLYCRIKKMNLKFSFNQHMWFGLMGIFLFGINYWLVYTAETTLPSGLVAMVFSLIVFLNSLNAALFLKQKIDKHIIAGGMVGITGLALLFKDEILQFNLSSTEIQMLVLAVCSAYLASLGNITSAYIQKQKLPVIQSNAFGMLYGTAALFLVSLILGKEFTFDMSFSYVSSLLYLSVFGSIVAFGAYLTLVGRIGADKAAYIILSIPLIAMILTTVFEGYHWTMTSLTGAALVVSGNYFAIRKFRKKHTENKN